MKEEQQPELTLQTFNTLTKKEATKQITSLAFSFALADFMIVSGSSIGYLFLNKRGNQYLPAGALISSSQVTIFAFAIGSLYSTGILMKGAVGEGNTYKLGTVFQQSLVYAGLLVIPGAIFMVCSAPLFKFLRQPHDLADIAGRYFLSYVAGLPPALGVVSIQQFALALNKPKIVIMTSLSYLVLCTGLSYVMVLGKLGCPALDEVGLGIANVITYYFNFIVFICYLAHHPQFESYQLFKKRSLAECKPVLKKLIETGTVIGLQMGLEIGTIFGMTAIIGTIGENELAADQIVLQYLFLLFIPLFSLGQSTGILCSGYSAANQPENTKIIGSTAHGLAVCFSTALMVLIICAKSPMIELFSPENDEVVTAASWLMIVMAVSQVFDALRNASAGALRGYGDVKAAAITGIGGLGGFGLPMGAILGIAAKLKATGVFLARGIGLVASAGYMTYRWWNKANHPPTPQEDSPEIHLITEEELKLSEQTIHITTFSHPDSNKTSSSSKGSTEMTTQHGVRNINF